MGWGWEQGGLLVGATGETADSSAPLRNDKQRGNNKGKNNGNSKNNSNSRFLR
jgi:hypothetical protein